MLPSGCLRDEDVVALLEGRLAPEAQAFVHRHAAECPACRALLVAVVRSDAPQADTAGAPAAPVEGGAPPEQVAAPPPSAWTPPAELDEFRLVRLLGRGGMGAVYLAHDTSLDRLVALKLIAAPQPGRSTLASFAIEARAIARIKHPNVVTVFRAGEVEGRPYIVYEYVVGKSLAELQLPLPWRRMLEIAVGLARGLRAAHQRRVLHRDLKPGNAILEGDGTVKLLDFGLAAFVDAERSAASAVPGVVGTPRYMAPEIRRGTPATAQSDLFALGLMLFELCTGQVPRARRTPASVAVGTGGEGPDASARMAELVPGIDPDFAAAIERCLAEDPAERFASADALCTALEQIARPATALPLPAGNPYRGLHPFDAEHRAFFFGRDDDIHAVLERLRRQPLVLVAGDSGVGKSSLCHAGILPRAAEGVLDERRGFTAFTLWPGRRPLEALAAALAPVLDTNEGDIRAGLVADSSWLARALRETHRGTRGLLLFVDQLEELITVAVPAEAARFAEILGELAALPAPGVRVLLAVRGDFLTRLAALPGLGDEVRRALYILRPLSPDGVREAIVGPARSRGVVFDSDALVTSLAESVAQGAGSLPLLEFTLAELWELRDRERGRITAATLAAMGGVAGALSQHADGVLARLGPEERQAARRVFLLLVTADVTRVERSEAELGTDDSIRIAVRALVEGRLLDARTSPDGTRYQVAHEALIERWGTLQRWLDEDAGHRAVLQRIEAASAEWERLGRSPQLLWSARQLAEVALADPRSLGPHAQAFVKASRGAVRRRRWGRIAAALLVPLTTAALYGGVRFQAYRETGRFIAARIAQAAAAHAEARAFGEQAAARREDALALFDGRSAGAGEKVDLWSRAEEKWAEALELYRNAGEAYDHADRALATALLRDGQHVQARQALAELLHGRLLLAERFHRLDERAGLLRALDRLDDGHWRRLLEAPAEVEIATSPPGALATVQRYIDDRGARHLEAIPGLGDLGATPLARSLPPGSYLFRFALPDRPEILLPVLLDRGERRQLHVSLPAQVPAGYVYIPPGCFLFGSSDPEAVRQVLSSPPLHRICPDKGYLIAQNEITLGDWITYLDSIGPSAAARDLLASAIQNAGSQGTLTLKPLTAGGWSFAFQRGKQRSVPVGQGERFHYAERSHRADQEWERFPLAGVSPAALQGYFEWLDRSGRLPDARLCDEYEWERAARGADDRHFPNGDWLAPDDANIDVTYGRRALAFGPDAVGAHPGSTSPFGLLDMAGNVFELTRPIPSQPGPPILRGGSWYNSDLDAYVNMRSPAEFETRNVTVGARVCASLPAE